MNQYIYEGPVMSFGKCLADKWISSTFASSKKKAENNLKYQYRKENNLAMTHKISLPGVLNICARGELDGKL